MGGEFFGFKAYITVNRPYGGARNADNLPCAHVLKGVRRAYKPAPAAGKRRVAYLHAAQHPT